MDYESDESKISRSVQLLKEALDKKKLRVLGKSFDQIENEKRMLRVIRTLIYNYFRTAKLLSKKLQASRTSSLKLLRVAKGYTLAELGERVNMTTSHISRIENGHRRCNMDLFYKLSKALECDPQDLVASFAPKEQETIESESVSTERFSLREGDSFDESS